MSEMAGLVSSSLPRFSHVARRLEGQGWLTRRPDPTDRRYTLATLTEELAPGGSPLRPGTSRPSVASCSIR